MRKSKRKSQPRPPREPELSPSSPNNRNDMMIQRAIASANKHGIDIYEGRKNAADGNCALESVIFNINDRPCFSDSFPFSADYYRRIWMTDFKNKTVNDPTWNIYSKEQWEKGWNEMME